GDLIGLYQFTQDKYEFNAEQLEAAIMELSPVFGESPVIKVARKDLEVIRATEIGQPFMNFSQAGPDGEMIEFASTVGEGKYVLLDFWASWCGPCMAELPYLLESYEKYHSKGFEIFGVSLDSDRQSWLNCIKNNKMNWIHTSDVKYWSNEVAVMYAIHSIPSNFLIDPEGKIIAKNLRGKALELKLQSLLD
ncbi:MAG: TlpA family protein disulfide reductase, partial [Bacteroidales bacterium]|nr:TlpA family protein disulfide reductase [Bacteroidales bacterium]